MQNTIQHVVALPMGNWLAQERQRLGRTRAEVAKAVRRHSATLRSIEQHNRVLPPGWYPVLRALGMQFQETAWPPDQLLYTGTDLSRDLRTCSGLQNSRYWLSEQLCITESEVSEVIRGSLPIPQSWLLKLAELGANVPARVRMALYPPVHTLQNPGLATAPSRLLRTTLRLPGDAVTVSAEAASAHLRSRIAGLSDLANKSAQSMVHPLGKNAAHGPEIPIVETKPRAAFAHDSAPASAAAPNIPEREASSARSTPTPTNEQVGAPVAAAARREQFSIFANFTEEGGLYFSISVPPSQTELMRRVMEALRGATETISRASTNSVG